MKLTKFFARSRQEQIKSDGCTSLPHRARTAQHVGQARVARSIGRLPVSLSCLAACALFGATAARADDRVLCGVDKTWREVFGSEIYPRGLASPDTHVGFNACTRLLATEPNNVRALVRRGRFLAEMSRVRVAEALKDIEKARGLEPSNPEVLEALDYITYAGGGPTGITNYSSDGTTTNGGRGPCRHFPLMPNGLTRAQESQFAAEVKKKTLADCAWRIEHAQKWKHEPKTIASLLAARADIFSYSQNDHALAIADLTRAIELVPNISEQGVGLSNEPYYARRGNIYGMQRKYDLAVADFSTILKQEPRLWEYIVRRGEWSAQAGRHDAAAADYTAAIAARADELATDKKENIPDPMLHVLRGISYSALKDKARARADFDEALKLPDAGAGSQLPGWYPERLITSRNHSTSHEIAKAELAKLK